MTIRTLLAWLLSLPLVAASFGSAAPSQGDNVEILADQQTRGPNGGVHATGNAVLTFKTIRIEAESIVFSPDSTRLEVHASGRVTFQRGDNRLTCAELRLELGTGEGEFRLQ